MIEIWGSRFYLVGQSMSNWDDGREGLTHAPQKRTEYNSRLIASFRR